ncbi:MAG TPA: PRC and DUF2382 domain-containing protein [Acidimicrobiales bacterium]|nr:PRC and DUF2382 domain-containing protein [Acidimicrobiales bacterium]
MTITETELQARLGQEVVDRSGTKIGKLQEIYVDEQGGGPAFLAVKTGLFGSKSTFVPVEGAVTSGDALTVPFDKDFVKDAPNVDEDGRISPADEMRLFEYYASSHGRPPATGGVDRTDTGSDTSGPSTDRAMTRSEEELRTGKTTQEAGRVRLRKYVVTENVTTTVPVQKEVARIEREPITDGNVDAAVDGPAISEEEHEMVLHEEKPVVAKQVVPKERVRVEKDVLSEDQAVSADLRKEQITTEGDGGLNR